MIKSSYEVKPCQMRISEKMPKARDSMKSLTFDMDGQGCQAS